MEKLNTVEQLGKRVRETRKAQGITQEELAATSGVGVRFIRELEQGKTSCHVGKVFEVVHMLGQEFFIESRENIYYKKNLIQDPSYDT